MVNAKCCVFLCVVRDYRKNAILLHHGSERLVVKNTIIKYVNYSNNIFSQISNTATTVAPISVDIADYIKDSSRLLFHVDAINFVKIFAILI
jgi:hypothetical protein